MTAHQIIAYYKGVQQAANVIGVTRQAFTHWKAKGVPKPIQKLVELESRGKLKADKR